MITGGRNLDHITPVLKELHWLPLNKRIQSKTLMLTYKSLNDKEPAYLTKLIHDQANSRTLRSSSELIRDIPEYKLKAHGQNACSVDVPTLWNKLLNQIKFSKSLNSFLIANTPFYV